MSLCAYNADVLIRDEYEKSVLYSFGGAGRGFCVADDLLCGGYRKGASVGAGGIGYYIK